MHIINHINLCPKCAQLPDIHIVGDIENTPRALIACCGLRINIEAKTKAEALGVAVDAWNLATECFEIGAKKD